MPRKAHCCCSSCSIEVDKRRARSAFGRSAWSADEPVTASTGDFALREIAGGNRQRRWFCASCGTSLLRKADTWPARTVAAGGCFTEMRPTEPTATASTSDRRGWLGVPGDCCPSI